MNLIIGIILTRSSDHDLELHTADLNLVDGIKKIVANATGRMGWISSH